MLDHVFLVTWNRFTFRTGSLGSKPFVPDVALKVGNLTRSQPFSTGFRNEIASPRDEPLFVSRRPISQTSQKSTDPSDNTQYTIDFRREPHRQVQSFRAAFALSWLWDFPREAPPAPDCLIDSTVFPFETLDRLTALRSSPRTLRLICSMIPSVFFIAGTYLGNGQKTLFVIAYTILDFRRLCFRVS